MPEQRRKKKLEDEPRMMPLDKLKQLSRTRPSRKNGYKPKRDGRRERRSRGESEPWLKSGKRLEAERREEVAEERRLAREGTTLQRLQAEDRRPPKRGG